MYVALRIILYIFIVIQTFVFSFRIEKEEIRCKTIGLVTKPFNAWYRNFQVNAYKIQNNITADYVHNLYYKVLSHSETFECSVQKAIGGKRPKLSDNLIKLCENQGDCDLWPQIDGVKNICMDKLFRDVKHDLCLVYSFGLADDWTFEMIMSQLGCKVKNRSSI